MAEESKKVDLKGAEEALKNSLENPKDNDAPAEAETTGDAQPGDQAAGKKKKSKSSKLKNSIAGGSSSGETSTGNISAEQLQQILAINPALKAEVGAMDPSKIQEMMKNMDLSQVLTGAVYVTSSC